MSKLQSYMDINLLMVGSVNGHHFEITGNGGGNPYEGKHNITLTVKKGGPLPFSYDILTTAFSYGNRVFTKYPEEMKDLDYFKKSFLTGNQGYSWERSMIFEDMGVCVVTSKITLDEKKKNCFNYDIRFYGVNFPDHGPVMTKKTVKWEQSSETMYARDGVQVGDVNRTLFLKEDGYYRCDFRSTYRANDKKLKPSKEVYYIDHYIKGGIMNPDEDGNQQLFVEESALARPPPFEWK